MIISHDWDEDMEKLKALKALADEVNAVDLDKLFVTAEQLANALGCSERRARELMRSPGFPSINLGTTPVVNVFALADYTRERIEYNDLKRGIRR